MPSMAPGELCYAAYRAVVLPSDWRVTLAAWADLPALHQEAWEAAAQAVLALDKERETPC